MNVQVSAGELHQRNLLWQDSNPSVLPPLLVGAGELRRLPNVQDSDVRVLAHEMLQALPEAPPREAIA